MPLVLHQSLDEIQEQQRLAAQRQAEAAERAQHWYSGETPTANEVLAQINRIWEVDQQRAQNAFYDFSKLQQDNTSTFYNPYTQATNPAVAALGQLGVVDVSNINDQWFADNAWLKEYFVTSDTSTSAKAPTKKSSMLEKAAYYYNLLDEQRGQTSAAQKEIEDLRRELSYKALDPGKNYSDEDIINHIDMSKYPTLQKMIEGRNKGEPIKLNSAVAYADKDWMLGVLWGARNGGGSGSDMQNQANSALGIGNKWKDNPLITAKMDAGNLDTYSPYELGMTLEEEGLFFGRYSFDQQWIDANYEKIMNGNDPVAKKYLANIINAESQTQEAEGAVAKLNEKIQEWINADYDEKDILDKVEKFKASNPILQKIDDSLYPVNLMGFNRPIQYGKKSMEEYVHAKYWERATAEEGALNFVQGQVDSAIRPDEPEAANNGGSPVEPEVPEAPETPEEERPEPEPGPAQEAQETPAPNSAPGAEPTPTPGPEQKQHNPQKVHKKVELPQAGPTPTPAPDAQRKSVQREQDKNLRTGIGIIDEDATPAEKSQMKSGWTVTWDDMQNMWGTMKSAWENISKNFLTGLKDTADNGFTSKAFSLMGTINEHEANVDRFTALSAQKDQMERKLGNLIYVGQEIQDENTITIHIGDNEVNLVMARVPTEEHPDGEFVLKAAVNTTTNQNSVMDGDDFYAALGGRQAFEDRISQTVAGFNDHVNRVKAANQMGAFLDEDGRKELEKYYSIKAEYADLEEKLAKEEEAYQTAKSDYRKAYGAWNRSNLLFGALGVVDEDQAYLLDMMDYAYSFSQPPQTQKYGFSAANMLDESIEFGKYSSDVGEVVNGVPAGLVEKINSDKEKLQENIQDIQFALDYFGENLPEEYRKHMQTEMANYQRNIDDYDYFLLNQKEDWQQMLEEGRKKDSRELAPDSYMSESYLYWRAMTQSEKDRYHYLLGKEGQSAADEYYRFLADEQNGVLPKRSNDDMKAAIAAGIGEDGVLLNLMAIGSTPASAIMSGIALLYSGVTGKELSEDNPLMFLNSFANTVNAETTRSISESLKDQPFASALAMGAYEILYNRGRSLMNAMAFPGLGMVNEFVGSMPMAVTAMADEVAKLKSAGAEDWQAWLLGGITLFTEAFTETIELGHIKEAKDLGLNSLKGIKDFLKEYPIKGLNEALGESLNTIIENNFDKIIMGDKSDWSQRVWEYMTTRGVDRDTAEAMATKDDIEEVIHTAVISFLSPATDVLSFVGGKLELYNDYRKEARKKKVSVKEIRQNRQNREQMLNALTEAAESREPGRIDYDALGRMYGTDQEHGPAVPRPQNATEIYEQRNDYLSDLEILETATQSNVASVRSSAISKVLNIGTSEVTADRANAAAMGVEDTFANGAADIQDILTGGMVAGTNSTTLKVGIQYAILGGEQSQCRQLVQSEEFRNATPDVQAEMLAQAAVADASNADVQNAVSSAVHENRVAIEEKKLIAAGEFKPIEPVKQKLSSDMAAARQAQQDLRQRTNEEKAAADALTAANEQFINDPGNDNNVNEMARATADLGDKQESTKQYEQHLEKAQTEQEKSEEEYNSNRSSAVATMREKAIEAVKNIDVQRAEQAEQERLRAEEEAANAKEAERQKLLDDERTGRIDEAIARQKIEALAKQNGLEGKEAEKFVNRLMQYRNDRMMNKIDMSKPFSASEGDVVMRQLEDRFGVKVVLTSMEGKENGKYDPSTNTITLNENLPAGQILVEFAMHELTHALEQTGAYQKYHDTVLGIMFDTEEKLNKAIATKINKYKEDGKELSVEQAKREIVAEYSRMKLSDRDTVNRLMDEGLGGKMRNFLHNINQFLKNRKLSGNEKTTAENLRRAERAFQMAINERAGSLKRQSPAAQVRADMQTAAENSIGIDVDNMTDAEKEAMLQEAGMDYKSAVDRGDMDAAQQDVDFYAQEAGYVKAGYHGTLNGGFTVFDKSKAGIGGNSGAGFYFSSNPDDSAANYSDVEGADNWFKANHLADRILEEFQNSDEETFEYEGYEITEGMPYKDVVEIAKKILTKNPQTYNVYLDPGRTYIRDGRNSTNLLDDAINNFDESLYDRDDYDSEDEYNDAISDARLDEIYQAISDAVYEGISDVESNYEIYSNVDYESIINKLSEIAMDYEALTWDDLIKVLSDQYIDIGTEDIGEPTDGSHEIARAIVEAFGYNSIEDREVSKKFNQLKNMGNAGDTIHYIMFEPGQIKLADPVTYDDNGKVIPLEKRFNRNNLDIRYSVGLDVDNMTDAQKQAALEQAGADYMSAIESGDMEKAQKDVEFVAKATGHTDKAFHGTDMFGFTEFDLKAGQGTIFVSYTPRLAKTYTEGGDIRKISDRDGVPVNYYVMNDDQLIQFIEKTVKDFKNVRIVEKDDVNKNDPEDQFAVDQTNWKGETETSIWNRFELEQLLDKYTTMNGDYSGVYELYTKPGRQLEIDAKGRKWNDIEVNDPDMMHYFYGNDVTADNHFTTRQIAQFAKSRGYDSVRIDNLYDNGGRNSNADERDGYGSIGIFFNQDDVKSADTITRDDNGNVIPLNERFTSNPDIRYATGDHELSEAEMNQALLDAGVITQEEENEQIGPQRQYGTKTLPKVDGVDPRVLEWLADHSDYEPDTNAEQVQRAVNWMMNNRNDADPEGFWNSLEQLERKGFNSLTPDGQARLYVMASAAARKNDVGVQIRINNLINTTGTSIGQALQARKLYRLMTPDGRKMVLKDEVNKINRDLKNEGKEGNVTLSDWLLQAAGDAQTEEEFAKVRAKFEEEMARQLPSTWKEKLRTWRMTSMLANPRTHARNFVGNLLFVPVVGLKNVVGQQLESAAAKRGFFGHALAERTKSFSHTADAEDFAAKDAKIMKDTLTGEAKYSPESRIEQYKKSFGRGQGILSRTIGKGVQSLADFNSWALEKEDWIFLNRHYQNAMAGYMTANNLTSDKMKGKTLEKARSYAILEAQKATYRDANAVSTWLNQMSKRGGIGGFLVDTVLPFKKTPANVLRRGIEYSPIGLISSFASAKKSLDLYASWEANGKQGDMPKGAKTVNEVLDGIAAGLTGTGIAALGALGYALGAVKLGFDKDDDKDAIEKADGHQEYSIELFGHSFTFDWAAPVCMPFFTGASLFKNLSENNLNFDLGSFLNAFAGISEPVFNLSMLDGVNTLLKTASYSQSGLPIGDIIQKIGANYIGSIIGPAALGAFARTVDPTSRRSYAESGDQASIWTMMLEQAQNKYPFLSRLNTPYRDMWGNEESQGWLEAALENFILPGYHKEIKNDPVNSELMRVYEAMYGEASVTPSAAAKKLGGEVLTDKEQDQYAARRGQIAYDLLSDLFSRPDYIALTELNPEAQADMIGNIYKYANAASRKELQPDYELEGWIKNGYESGSPIDSLFASEEKKAQDKEVKSHKLDLFGSILMNDSDGISTHVEGLKRAGKSDSDIRSMLTEEFKPQYIEAYIASLNGDLEAGETMEQIASCLKFIDLGKSSYTDKDLEKWLKGIGDNTSGSFNPNNMLGGMMTTLDTGGGRGNRELMWQSMYNNTAGNEYGLGNIDLNNRQVVWNPDGTFSTEQSFSVNIDGKEVLLPTVIDGRIVSEDEAIEHYYRTGEYLGRFDTVEEAEEYARRLHQRQEWYYSR